ncbi:hypothetical protein KKC45_03720 [Patescibacteria group bacterium]|nr:hypothetical protein [Patescibacteria group bacterium]
MKNRDFKKEILKTIETKKIEPKSKWQFLLRDSIVWVFGFISVIAGGIFASVIIFSLFNSDWEVYRLVKGSFLEFIPIVWIFVFAIFIFVADYNFKHTKKGYRYGVTKVILLSSLASILLGFVFYATGLSHLTDRVLDRGIPGYTGVEKRKEMMTNQPEKGLLAGTLVLSPRSDALVLKDFDGKEWDVIVGKLLPVHFIILDNVETVAFIGNIIGENTFEACDVKPWQIRGESLYLREKIFNQMKDSGIEPPVDDIDRLRKRFEEENLDERNIFQLRNNVCEEGTSTPFFTKPR